MLEMEKRQFDRVNFFQLSRDGDLIPVWVFHRARPDTVLGVLVDISAEGVQILTDKSSQLDANNYLLIVHVDEALDRNSIDVRVNRLWSKSDGTLYIRNGFAFRGGEDLTHYSEQLLVLRDTGHQWLRCELAAT